MHGCSDGEDVICVTYEMPINIKQHWSTSINPAVSEVAESTISK